MFLKPKPLNEIERIWKLMDKVSSINDQLKVSEKISKIETDIEYFEKIKKEIKLQLSKAKTFGEICRAQKSWETLMIISPHFQELKVK